MTLKRILTISLMILLLPVFSAAEGTMSGKLIIKSNPSGAYLTVKGEVILSGITPVSFDQLLVGKYKITASMPGYEDYNNSIIIDPTKETIVDITLKPKSSTKAGLRSLLIPGWGQRYSDQKNKGLLFTALTAGAVAAYFIADKDFDDKYDKYNSILAQYDSLTTVSARQSLYPGLLDAHESAYDAEDVRLITVGVVAGVWALNVIDALFFFPDNRGRIVVKDITFQPDLNYNSPGVKLSYNF